MPNSSPDTLLRDPEFQALVKRKNSISLALTVTMLVVYFGFAALLAFTPEILAAPVGRATLGIPIGIGVIVFAWILTGLYVRWANTQYDAAIAAFKARYENKSQQNNTTNKTTNTESA